MAIKPNILMCAPEYFDVFYEINAWMHKDEPFDHDLSVKQWKNLYNKYVELGYHVELIEPIEGLPDMVFTANGGLLKDGKAVLPNFTHPERQGETKYFKQWFEDKGYETLMPQGKFEGEGDAMFVGGKLFGGYGFRSSPEEYQEIAEYLDSEVILLELIDPRFYHFDTCLTILDSKTVAFYPGAFSDEAQNKIRNSVERVIEVEEADAVAFGLNTFSDEENVVVSAQAIGFHKQLEELGFKVHPVDVSEFKKSGGGIKCLTLLLDQIH